MDRVGPGRAWFALVGGCGDAGSAGGRGSRTHTANTIRAQWPPIKFHRRWDGAARPAGTGPRFGSGGCCGWARGDTIRPCPTHPITGAARPPIRVRLPRMRSGRCPATWTGTHPPPRAPSRSPVPRRPPPSPSRIGSPSASWARCCGPGSSSNCRPSSATCAAPLRPSSRWFSPNLRSWSGPRSRPRYPTQTLSDVPPSRPPRCPGRSRRPRRSPRRRASNSPRGCRATSRAPPAQWPPCRRPTGPPRSMRWPKARTWASPSTGPPATAAPPHCSRRP